VNEIYITSSPLLCFTFLIFRPLLWLPHPLPLLLEALSLRERDLGCGKTEEGFKVRWFIAIYLGQAIQKFTYFTLNFLQ